jgi:hypothetical protein
MGDPSAATGTASGRTGGSGGASAASAREGAAAGRHVVDFEGLAFGQGGHYMSNKSCSLPPGSYRCVVQLVAFAEQQLYCCEQLTYQARANPPCLATLTKPHTRV